MDKTTMRKEAMTRLNACVKTAKQLLDQVEEIPLDQLTYLDEEAEKRNLFFHESMFNAACLVADLIGQCRTVKSKSFETLMNSIPWEEEYNHD